MQAYVDPRSHSRNWTCDGRLDAWAYDAKAGRHSDVVLPPAVYTIVSIEGSTADRLLLTQSILVDVPRRSRTVVDGRLSADTYVLTFEDARVRDSFYDDVMSHRRESTHMLAPALSKSDSAECTACATTTRPQTARESRQLPQQW